VLSPLSSQGATVIFDNILPTSNVILSNSQKSSSGAIQVYNLPGTGDRWVGFGFQTISAALLDKVTFTIYNDLVYSGALGATLTLSIVSLPTLTGAPAAPLTVLYSESATVPLTYSQQDYFTFDLVTSYQLAASSSYGILLSFSNPAVANKAITLWQSSVNTAGTNNLGSTFYTMDGGATYTTSSSTLNFVLQTVPEPSSVLLSLSALGVLALLWRRKSIRA
jgi:hypothetical protein